MCGIRLRAVVLLFLWTLNVIPAPAAGPEWLCISTPNFELYTTANEKRGREVILYFEQVRAFFIAIGQPPPPAPQPTRIVGFNSEREFIPYRDREATTSFSFRDGTRNYVVMEKVSSERFSAAVYHYVQALLSRAEGERPLWLRIGLGEVYSTLKPYGGKMQVGEMIEGWRQLLERSRLMDLNDLMLAGYQSSLYASKETSQVFYAQSWALTHMLMLSDAYRPKYGELIRVLVAGTSPGEAFQQVYGKTLQRVRDELGGYLRGSWFKVMYFDTRLEKRAEAPEVRPATAVESGLVLASLLHTRERQAEREVALAKLAAAHPESWEVAEAQAYAVSDREGGIRAALPLLARAAQLGSTNPQLHYDYAAALSGTGGAEDAVRAALHKAVQLQPEFAEARLRLGHLLFQEGVYAQAIAHLGQLKGLEHGQEVDRLHMIARAYHELKMPDDAAKVANLLLEISRDEREITAAKQLIRYVAPGDAREQLAERGPAPLEQSRLPESPAEERYGMDDGETPSASQPAREEAAAEAPEPEDAPGAPADARPVLTRREDVPPPPQPAYRRPGAPETVRVEGTLAQFDCLGNIARLTLTANGRPVALAIMDPNKIVVRSSAQGELNFSCGRQRPIPVVIYYEAKPDAKLGTLGEIRVIEMN